MTNPAYIWEEVKRLLGVCVSITEKLYLSLTQRHTVSVHWRNHMWRWWHNSFDPHTSVVLFSFFFSSPTIFLLCGGLISPYRVTRFPKATARTCSSPFDFLPFELGEISLLAELRLPAVILTFHLLETETMCGRRCAV